DAELDGVRLHRRLAFGPRLQATHVEAFISQHGHNAALLVLERQRHVAARIAGRHPGVGPLATDGEGPAYCRLPRPTDLTQLQPVAEAAVDLLDQRAVLV